MQYRSGYSASNSYVVNAYDTPVVSKEPFTTTGLTIEINQPCGPVTLYATDLVASAGEYSTFLASRAPTGPWTAGIDFTCPDLGFVTAYVQGDGELVVEASVMVQDNQSWCDGCP